MGTNWCEEHGMVHPYVEHWECAPRHPDRPGIAALRHALAVAEHKAEQTGPGGFPLVGSVERAAFLIETVHDFLGAR